MTHRISEIDLRFIAKMEAEAIEHEAYEAFKRDSTAEAWLAHQRAVERRELVHARYLDALIAEQAALARV